MTDWLHGFVEFLRSHGAEPPSALIADGKFRHLGRVENRKKKSFTYVLYVEPVVYGTLIDKVTGEKKTWRGGNERPDREQRAKWEALKAERAAKAEKARIEARSRAREICEEAHPARANHPYLVKKHIQPYLALLQFGHDLIVPLVSIESEIQTIERISPTGDKKFLTGGPVAGNFYALGEAWTCRRLLICEGVATAHTLFEATEIPVIAAMFAGNLEPVARVIGKMNRQCKVLLCADDDWKTKGNPGLTAATKAASVVDGRVITPNFEGYKRGIKDTDFNDLQILAGLSQVRKQIIWAM